MWCARRCARDETGPLFKYRRLHLESTTILQQMIALMECQTRQEAVQVSDIKLLSLLTISLFSTLLLDNVGKNVHHTLFITCLKWIHWSAVERRRWNKKWQLYGVFILQVKGLKEVHTYIHFLIIFIAMLHYIIISNTTCYLHWIHSGYFFIENLQWFFLL